MRAEAQKLEAENMLSGTAGKHIENKTIDLAESEAQNIVNAFR